MSAKKPNVVVIYADDLGFGDVSGYGAEDLQTPNVDKLLDCGVKFTSGYSTSAVCSPARYSLLTGAYPFRQEQARILKGNAGCIIETERQTMPKVFQQAGYRTGIVGKWHLGLSDGNMDWNTSIPHTPNDIGFDYSFIFPATADRVPCVYVENHDVVNLDLNDPIEVFYGKENPFEDIATYANSPEKIKLHSSNGHMDSLVHGVGRMGFARGGNAAIWKDEDLAETFLDKAKSFVDENAEEPFFLYYALHQPHVPRIPSKRFAGTTKLGVRGDVIAELDWCVGEIVNHLEEKGLLDDTIIVFSSDNGPVLDDGYQDQAVELNGAHCPAGGLRGTKYSKYEGGARVPFIISWKSHFQPRTCDAIISQVDLMASFAAMLDVPLEKNGAPDSVNLLPLIMGESDCGRTEVLTENNQKRVTIRQGKWTYLAPVEMTEQIKRMKPELGNRDYAQLFNVAYDRAQQTNLAEVYPEIVSRLDVRMNELLKMDCTR